MGNKWDEMREAYKEAETTIKAADFLIADMAKMISGKLRNIELNYQNYRILSKLKRELSEFNLNTRKWK
jgi:hypothetical protein